MELVYVLVNCHITLVLGNGRFEPSSQHQFLSEHILGVCHQTQFLSEFPRWHFATKKNPKFIKTCHEGSRCIFPVLRYLVVVQYGSFNIKMMKPYIYIFNLGSNNNRWVGTSHFRPYCIIISTSTIWCLPSNSVRLDSRIFPMPG